MKLLTEGLAVLAPGMSDSCAAVESAVRDSTRVAQDTTHDVLAQMEKALARIEALSERRRELYKERAKGRADWTTRAAMLRQLQADKVAGLEKDFQKRQAELRKELADHSKQRGGELQLRAAIEGMLSAI
ncbi:hypothetical protein FA09DRAFT_327305 [Tilletiopsis washingtonensis]|uniref:Uncharacterized protein n=1 Tax=Tilletiopsis washingtonensis TaxID=58919 RepID=A0A316ZHY2_9BASI|nr:hypothetical protein FA09DRAFT_327305 [Tilletiopsis washingtonensis]PWO01371.1 hypothetical protein FA09DRAFT_327305 [Tilletiopsis washingtonensis]